MKPRGPPGPRGQLRALGCGTEQGALSPRAHTAQAPPDPRGRAAQVPEVSQIFRICPLATKQPAHSRQQNRSRQAAGGRAHGGIARVRPRRKRRAGAGEGESGSGVKHRDPPATARGRAGTLKASMPRAAGVRHNPVKALGLPGSVLTDPPLLRPASSTGRSEAGRGGGCQQRRKEGGTHSPAQRRSAREGHLWGWPAGAPCCSAAGPAPAPAPASGPRPAEGSSATGHSRFARGPYLGKRGHQEVGPQGPDSTGSQQLRRRKLSTGSPAGQCRRQQNLRTRSRPSDSG